MNEPKTKPVIVASKKVKPSSSEDSSDEENAQTNVELPQKKTKPQSSSDSSDDSDAPQKPTKNDSIVKKQDTKAVPVSKQITKQPFVAAKHPNGSSDSSDDDDTVTSISKKPDVSKEKVFFIKNI